MMKFEKLLIKIFIIVVLSMVSVPDIMPSEKL